MMIEKYKITDEELDALWEARLTGRPISREQADLELSAIFLMTAHRWKLKGKQLRETRRVYKGLCQEPGLLDELRKREMLLGPLTAP